MAYTPWLTVSVGLVAAAMVTLAVPHAAITLPPAPSGTCALSSCQVGHRVDRESAAKRRARPTLPARRPVRRPVARPAVQVELTFAVLAEHQGRFLATIEIRGGRPLGHWTLRFVLPGGTVMRVVWGRWATSGQGVIIYGSPPSWRHGKGDEVRLLVYGTGTPGWPSACAFDGAPCAFVAPSR